VTRDEFERRMHEWRDSESTATQAETALRAAGQGANDPRLAQLHLDARTLRGKADGLLAALVMELNQAVANRR